VFFPLLTLRFEMTSCLNISFGSGSMILEAFSVSTRCSFLQPKTSEPPRGQSGGPCLPTLFWRSFATPLPDCALRNSSMASQRDCFLRFLSSDPPNLRRFDRRLIFASPPLSPPNFCLFDRFENLTGTVLLLVPRLKIRDPSSRGLVFSFYSPCLPTPALTFRSPKEPQRYPLPFSLTGFFGK